MRNFIKYMFWIILITIAQPGYAQLTGEWKDDNGACYKIRQVDNQIYWSMDGSPLVINVFMGYLAGNYITGTWADLPGGSLQNNGTLSLRVDNNNQMTVIGQSRTYGGTVLTRSTCTEIEKWEFDQHNGWTGTWTRSGDNDIFIGKLNNGSKTVNTVVKIEIVGKEVTVTRIESSNKILVTYKGQFQNDGNTVKGSYSWSGGRGDWTAKRIQ